MLEEMAKPAPKHKIMLKDMAKPAPKQRFNITQDMKSAVMLVDGVQPSPMGYNLVQWGTT